MASFTIGETDFQLDGAPHRILSGAIHYFRVHPDQWADRIHTARLMGLNTIETYVAWNAHEPRHGEWDASGALDLGRFLDLVAAEGMHAIVRPGPYICAEWHNGGLPVWLTGMGIPLRESNSTYLAEVTRYLERVYEIVAPRQIDRGGNVILVQIENEYGAYGDDKDYLAELARVTRAADITVPLTTVDQPVPQMLRDGSLPGLHLTGSFGSRATERLATLREHQPTGPLMCSEFWDGWFDWWGGIHHTTDAAASAAELDTLLAAGASVNLYMVHGGTNFGLTNGANHKGRYLPLVTSYDYDAPIDEAGHPTAKFHAFREVIAKYAPVPDEVPAAAEPAPVMSAALESFEVTLPEPLADTYSAPPSFDELGHLSALVRYETDLPHGGLFVADEIRDRAWVSVDGLPIGTLDRMRSERAIVVPRGRLSVLVEDLGRVNYGPLLGEEKGLFGGTLGETRLENWSVAPIEVAALAAQAATAPAAASTVTETAARPAGLRGSFTLTEQSDLFLRTEDWGKGYVFVNGFFVGRYWTNGPQRTLYVPKPVTKTGQNEIVVIELEQLVDPTAHFVAEPSLGFLEE